MNVCTPLRRCSHNPTRSPLIQTASVLVGVAIRLPLHRMRGQFVTLPLGARLQDDVHVHGTQKSHQPIKRGFLRMPLQCTDGLMRDTQLCRNLGLREARLGSQCLEQWGKLLRMFDDVFHGVQSRVELISIYKLKCVDSIYRLNLQKAIYKLNLTRSTCELIYPNPGLRWLRQTKKGGHWPPFFYA